MVSVYSKPFREIRLQRVNLKVRLTSGAGLHTGVFLTKTQVVRFCRIQVKYESNGLKSSSSHSNNRFEQVSEFGKFE